MTVTCRRCGHAVTVPTDGASRLWAGRGARLHCDGCGGDMGDLRRAIAYVEAKVSA